MDARYFGERLVPAADDDTADRSIERPLPADFVSDLRLRCRRAVRVRDLKGDEGLRRMGSADLHPRVERDLKATGRVTTFPVTTSMGCALPVPACDSPRPSTRATR